MNIRYSGELGDKFIQLSNSIDVIEKIPRYKVVEDGVILPRKFKKGGPYQGIGGVVDKEGNYVIESAIYDLDEVPTNRENKKLAFGGKYRFASLQKINKTAIYLGLANKHWGHFIIDNIQRLWFPLAAGMIDPNKKSVEFDLKSFKDYEFVYVGTGQFGDEFIGNYKSFFELLGLDVKKIKIVNEVMQYDTVVVPDVAIYPGRFIYSIIREVFEIVVNNSLTDLQTLPNSKERIFFSRAHLPNQLELGTEQIEESFRKCGFEVLYPEELTLKEQIYYWNTAKEIACINGTIPHNAVFAKNNLKLYVINKMSRVVGYQSTIDKIWCGEPVYIAAYKEPFKRYPLTVNSGPFWLIMNENVISFFRNELHLVYDQTDNKSFMCKYLFMCLATEIKLRLSWFKRMIKSIIRRRF